MYVLIRTSGGSAERGVLGALVERGHRVALSGPGASALANRWAEQVTAVEGEARAAALAEADVTIVEREPVSLSAPPAGGTPAPASPDSYRGARRLVLLSPLGEEGDGDLEQARALGVPWMVVRAATVFGAAEPSVDLVSNLVALVRNLTVLPTLPSAHVPFAPVFAPDFGRLLVRALESEQAWGKVHVARGAEVVTFDELITRVAGITGKSLLRVPLPEFLGGAGATFAWLFGVKLPRLDAALRARFERARSVTADAFADFALGRTSIDDALGELAKTLPVQLPTEDEGYGALSHKRFWVDIEGGALPAGALLDEFREHCPDIMPIEFDVEPGVEQSVVRRRRMLTASLTGRGHIQMRVEESGPGQVIFATIEGHPIAGIVRFLAGERGGRVRFMVEVFARSATPFDFVAFKAGAQLVQDMTWRTVCSRMLERSGGTSEKGVEHEVEKLDEGRAAEVAAWIEEIVARNEREQHAPR